MNSSIYYYKDVVKVHPELHKDWLVKTPTTPHRLHKSGTVSLTVSQLYDLRHTKKGIVFVDMTKKAFVYLPNSILEQRPPEPKDFNGVPNSLFVFNVKQIIEEFNLPITKIPLPTDPKVYETGVAGDVRKKFGL